MTRGSLALLLLLLAAGCGKYAAADDALARHENVVPRQQHPQPPESDPYREECKWTKRLFC
jgi:hypothetical protein